MEQTSPISLTPPENKKLNKANILMACLMVLMLGAAITFGILWATKKTEAPAANNNPPAEVEDCATTGSSDHSADASNPGYIYVGQWGIKIKVPEALQNLHYSYNADGADKYEYSDGSIKIYDHKSMLVVGGTNGSGDGVTPDFASAALGSVSRYEEGTYNCQASCPAYITTIAGYEYYYGHPQMVTSRDQSDIEWETSSVQLVEEMLSSASNYSAF